MHSMLCDGFKTLIPLKKIALTLNLLTICVVSVFVISLICFREFSQWTKMEVSNKYLYV